MGLSCVLAIRAQVDGPCAACLTSIILVTALLCDLEAWQEPLRVSTAAAVAGTGAEGLGSGVGGGKGQSGPASKPWPCPPLTPQTDPPLLVRIVLVNLRQGLKAVRKGWLEV